MSKVKRVYVEKKVPYAVKAKELTEDIKDYLEISGLENKMVRLVINNRVPLLGRNGGYWGTIGYKQYAPLYFFPVL